MPRRTYGGVIVTEQDSPLTHLLAGVAQGATERVKKIQQKVQDEKDLSRDLLFQIATGKIDARELASAEGRAFIKTAGLDKNTELMGIVDAAGSTIPYEPGKEPTAVQLQTGEEEFGGAGGPAVNIPKPYSDPSADYVGRLLSAEAGNKALGMEEKKQGLLLARQIDLAVVQDALKQNRVLTPKERMEATLDMAEQIGLDMSDVRFSIDEKGGYTITMQTQDTAQKQTSSDRTSRNIASYNDDVGRLSASRTSHLYRLRSILSSDYATAQNMIDEGVDPRIARLLDATLSSLRQNSSKDRVLENADAVEKLLESINEGIKRGNRNNIEYGKSLRDGSGGHLFDEPRLRDGIIKEITFEDVAGMSKEEYLKRRKPPTADDLISSMRDTYKPSGIVQGGSATYSAAADADKVKAVFDGIREIASSSMADDPSLSGEDVKEIVMQHKDEIMAEYGLNERLFQIVVDMADKALA